MGFAASHVIWFGLQSGHADGCVLQKMGLQVRFPAVGEAALKPAALVFLSHANPHSSSLAKLGHCLCSLNHVFVCNTLTTVLLSPLTFRSFCQDFW